MPRQQQDTSDHKRATLGVRLLALLLCSSLFLPQSVQATAPLACEDGAQSSGATYRICMPAQWNNRLVVYAHGYVSPTRPVGIPEDQMRLPGSTFSVDQLVTNQGYAFATSGYSTNGLAIQEGIADLVDVVAIFKSLKGTPTKVMLVGVSEGGAIATLALERHPELFDGGLAMCGPYGSFRGQINYFGDFRVLFDHFLPDVMPPNPIAIPADLLTTWETGYYTNTVKPALTAITNTTAISQLLTISQTPFDATDSATKEQSMADLLWYNVFATNDAITKLGGQPFDNQMRQYGQGLVNPPLDLTALNQKVARFSADQAALTALTQYESTGRLTKPLITMHTTGDPIVPYWQTTLYRGKTIAADNIALHEVLTVSAYGHCRFSTFDVLGAFTRLVTLVDTPPVYQPAQRAYLPLTVQP
jgi:pimeloyl-ACP methyl ester carboxylesterase